MTRCVGVLLVFACGLVRADPATLPHLPGMTVSPGSAPVSFFCSPGSPVWRSFNSGPAVLFSCPVSGTYSEGAVGSPRVYSYLIVNPAYTPPAPCPSISDPAIEALLDQTQLLETARDIAAVLGIGAAFLAGFRIPGYLA